MKKETLRQKILRNVEDDRNKSNEFIQNINEYLDLNTANITGLEYSKIIESASKLMEARQRSNEQIVKIFDILSKKKPKVDTSSAPTQEEIDAALEDQTVEIGNNS